ncbi:hypothetical protein M0813_03127 [Anaeramoeba flamelloides]|uniref:Uncharacterized protein n=1 Tax=Anaeramoeba flamelloides TaxID=1746091 RepID=A0ABQ8Y550_9EUKA|nr:hypothetical protein M0813_03127 [Anaeramoeba flamelloides]
MSYQKNDERILFEASLALISLKEKFKQEKIYQRALERSTFQMLYGNIHLMNQNMVYGQELVEMKNVQRSNEQIKVISGLKKDSAQEINDKKVETTNKSINESDNTKTGEEDKKINDFKRVSLGELKEFLHAKPRPPWSSRLESFYRYNPKLIVGWKTGFADTFMHSNLKDKSHKVIISKDLFTEFANLTKIADTKQAFLRVYKSSQRGVEEFFKKIGFVKIANYSREKVVFAYKK